MADQLQLRGGTTSEHSTFTGALREVTVDTDKDTLIVHDAATAGGHPLLREDGSNSALSLGTAGTPSIKFTGDTNTGIYSPGADQVAISTNGQGRLFVDSSGRVGVGINSPAGTLHLAATYPLLYLTDTDATGSARSAIGSPDGNLVYFANENNQAGGNHIFYRNGNNEAARIDSSGRVGIGTSSPSARLQIEEASPTDGILLYLNNDVNSSGSEAGFRIRHNDTDQLECNVLTERTGLNAGLDFKIELSGSDGTVQERFRVTEAGNVGVGTSNPGTALDVVGITKTSLYFSVNNNGYIRGDTAGELRIQPGTNGTVFTNAGNSAEYVRIDSSGRVGVGTSSPGRYLDLWFSDATSYAPTTRADQGLRVFNSSNTTGAFAGVTLSANNGGSTTTEWNLSAVSTSNNYQADLSFQTRTGSASWAERLRITNNGNVGVGTTSPGAPLTIQTDSSANNTRLVGRSTGDNRSDIQFYQNNGTSFIGSLSAQDNSMNIFLSGASGDLKYTASQHTFRDENGLTVARIDSSGRVGIGTSSPNANVRLEVNGNISSNGDASPNGAGITIGDNQSGGYKWIQSFENHPLVLNPLGNNVGIGTTSPGDYNSDGDDLVIAGSGNKGITISSTSGGTSRIYFADGTTGTEPVIGSIRYQHSNNSLNFSTNATDRLTIDSSGRLLVGTSSAIQSRHIESATTGGNNLGVYRFANGAGGSDIWLYRSRGTTIGAHGVAQSGDVAGQIHFAPSDGTNYIRCAAIEAQVDGIPGTSDMPGRLVFSTTADGASAPTERMRINSNGTSVYAQPAASEPTFQVTSSGTVWDVGAIGGNTPYYILDSNNVGVRLISGATAWGASSDERLKTNLVPIADGLAKVSTLRACTGKYINDEPGTSRSFLIAQDVQAVLPEAVSEDEDEDRTLTLRYAEVIPLLVAALKEGKERIETLEAKVAALEAN